MMWMWMLASLALAQETTEAAADAVDAAPEAGVEDDMELEPTGPDRSGPPEVAAPVPVELADLAEYPISPAATAWHVQVEGVRDVTIEVRFYKGYYELGGPGVTAEMTGGLWDVASEAYDAELLSNIADRHEVDVRAGLGGHSAYVRLTVPKENLSQGIPVLQDLVRNPTFPNKDLKRTRTESQQWFALQLPNSPDALASVASGYGWYPADHPYGHRTDWNAYGSVKRKDLVALHQRVIRESPITVLVTGDVAWDDVSSSVRQVVEGLGAKGDWAADLAFEPPKSSRIIAVDMPEAKQSVIRLRLAGPWRNSEDENAAAVVNYALGGHFLSRLNANLREDKGFTYGSRSRLSPRDTRGVWDISVDVQAKNTGAAMAEIEHELSRVVAEGVTNEEMDMSWRGSLAWFNSVRQTGRSAFGFYAMLLSDQETVSDVLDDFEAVDVLRPPTTQKVAQQWLGEDAPRQWVVVGPKSEIADQLETLGLPVQWVDSAAVRDGTLE